MEKFYLETNEDFISIIDKIKQSEDDSITLIVPKGLSALRSIINLRILKEEAISLGKDVSIITPDTLIKKLSQQTGLRILESEGKPAFAEASAGKKLMSDIVSPAPSKEPIEKEKEPVEEEADEYKEFGKKLDDLGEKEKPFGELFEKPVEEEEEIIEEVHRPSFKFFTKKRVIALLVILALIGSGFILYFVLPRAQIIINPKTETIRFETEVVVNKNIDSIIVTDNSIPGQVFQLEMEDSRKFPTTGEKEVEEKAKGTITVYNQYSSSDQTLVKTTRFLSENGKLFRLIETTVIPGAEIVEGEIVPSKKDVEVMADEPGESHNIGPSNFTIPGFEGTAKYTGFYGKSTEAMKGGAKGKMRVATKDDIQGATEIVSIELKDKTQKQFSKKIPEELKILEDSQILEITESSSSLQADEPGKEFLVTVKVRAWTLAFKEEDVFYLIEKNINDKISENKTLISSTIQIKYNSTEIDLAQGRANLACEIEADAAWSLDKDKLEKNLAGKNEIEVRKYLSGLSEIQTAKVVFWPFWVKKIPKNKDRIKIIVDIES